MTADVIATGSMDLSFKQAVLSSVRVLRDYQALGTFPAEVAASPMSRDSTITWARDRLDGAAGYRLTIQVTHGSLHADHVTAASDGTIALKITALSGEMPLTPLWGAHLLNDQAQPDAAARNVLTFLSYKEKFLAGSWRFNTYFGRDTLMSVRLLMPVLAPEAVEAGLGAVLTRLSAKGEVAHEEDIGEFAILDHLRATGEKSDAPTFNYNMIDGSFMLAPVAAQWLLDDARGRTQAAAFLERIDGRRETPKALGADLVSNFKFVLKAAAKFAYDPHAPNLIALKPGFDAGQWRDSNDGLGGGRFPYDVNAVFVPAALDAAARFFESGLLAAYLDAADRELFSHAKLMAATWREKAGPLFDVSVPSTTARRDITDYAASLKIADGAALRSVDDYKVSFPALSLAADDKTIPVLHSDVGFELLFGQPTSKALEIGVTALMRPFPAGLLTSVGVVVANPVYAGPAIQSKLTRSAYHGTVVWSWQQAVLAAGLRRQLQRPDLPPVLKQSLRAAQTELWRAIGAAHSMRNSELWTWDFAKGNFEIAPFGANAADADESNAAQLWSTVYLAIPAP
jgi:glycogen debranching enzyme